MPATIISFSVKIPLHSDSCFPFSLPWRWKEMIILSLKATCYRWKSHCRQCLRVWQSLSHSSILSRMPALHCYRKRKENVTVFEPLLWDLFIIRVYFSTHLKRPWCWERLRAGGEGDNRGWDGWVASPIQWTWVWVNSGSWWWTGRPGALQYVGSKRVGHNWATKLNWLNSMGYNSRQA